MKVKSSWFAGLSAQEAAELKTYLASNKLILSRLKGMLEKRIEASYLEQRSKTNYEDSNWALKQADYIGCQRTYKEIVDLLNMFED